MERYASVSVIPGRASCCSTACSALMVAASMRLAPRAIPSVRTTRCRWIWSCASSMLRRATRRACSGVGTPLEEAEQPTLPLSSWEAAAATDEVDLWVSVARGMGRMGAAQGRSAPAAPPPHAASALWPWWWVSPLAQESSACATSRSTARGCASSSARAGGRAVGFASEGRTVYPLEVLDGGPGGSEGGGDGGGE